MGVRQGSLNRYNRFGGAAFLMKLAQLAIE